MQFTTFTHLSKVPPHEYGGCKISFRRRNENSETTKTEARWGTRNGLGKPHFHHCAPLTTQITFHFHSCSVPQLSLPAGRFATRSWIVSRRRNLRKGEGPGRREAQPGRIKKSPVITKAFRDWSKRKQWKLNGSLLRWSRLELIMNSPLNFFFQKNPPASPEGFRPGSRVFLRERARGWSGRRKKGSASPMQPLRWEAPGRVERARTALNELFSR